MKTLLAALGACASLLAVQGQELLVGADYHPHDSDPKIWARDIALMRQAGFRIVRMGHLAWDSYEPADGKFDFRWFDQVMDEMQAADIKVVLDLAVRPAPLWLHHSHPSVDVTDAGGAVLYPNHRYMEDVGDAVYQRYALRYAHALVAHYARHPALLGFGIDNEPGDGPISYSPATRARFIAWLRQKYGTPAALNTAWSGQRWSRRITDFDEVGLPLPTAKGGAPERVLDFRRFVSDEVTGFLAELLQQVHADAPGALTTGNWWYYSPMKYFDYSPLAYSGQVSRGGCGFYPGDSLERNDGLESALFGIARIQYENSTPFWCTEFVGGTAAPGSIRKAAYASLMMGNQMVCGWTWQSMWGGEEQFLEGMLDWDGRPNRVYAEYRQVAEEFRKIEGGGFPYRPHPQAALAFSFPSQIASAAFPEAHDRQVQTAFTCLNRRNVEVRVVDLGRSALDYKLLVLPGVAVMDPTSAQKIRDFVRAGGTVVMTSYSDMLDEHNRVFSTPLPGLLGDVFGLRLARFESSETMNELSRLGLKGEALRASYRGRELDFDSPRFDVIEPEGAEVLGSLLGLDQAYPLVTRNRFGAGSAIYIAIPARAPVLASIVDDCIASLHLDAGPVAPEGVMARRINATHNLYLNLQGTAARVPLPGGSHSVLYDRDYNGGFVLGPFQPDFVELNGSHRHP